MLNCLINLNNNQRDTKNMKSITKKKVTICLDKDQHKTLQDKLNKERRSLSSELNNIITFMNDNKLTTDQLLRT